jgi:homoserine O-succinyltransferase/O-acetyltransferase
MSYSPYDPSNGATPLPAAVPTAFESRVGRDPSLPLEIGLVNNMPDAALRSTERQIRGLLERSCGDLCFNLRVYIIPEVPRSQTGRELARNYHDIGELWQTALDGVIVTGTEPRTEDLREEPYWGTLTRLMEWADEHTASSIWSCLAAHAALQHMDGIERRRLAQKRFGVFECTRQTDHLLTQGLPQRLRMPHSRWNELAEEDLVAAGYSVLTRSPEAGADAFVKQRRSLFLFFQGHPEYDADTLIVEYRRDIGRYLRGERETYPTLPRGCFDGAVLQQLQVLRLLAANHRDEATLSAFPLALATAHAENSWRETATALYRNWLQYLAASSRRVCAA